MSRRAPLNNGGKVLLRTETYSLTRSYAYMSVKRPHIRVRAALAALSAERRLPAVDYAAELQSQPDGPDQHDPAARWQA